MPLTFLGFVVSVSACFACQDRTFGSGSAWVSRVAALHLPGSALCEFNGSGPTGCAFMSATSGRLERTDAFPAWCDELAPRER